MGNTVIRDEKTAQTKRSLSLTYVSWRQWIALSLLLVAFYLFISIVSHFFTGRTDQSVVDAIISNHHKRFPLPEITNWVGKLGALVGHFLVFEWLGVCALLLPIYLGVGAYNLYRPSRAYDLRPLLFPSFFGLLWVNTSLGYLAVRNVGGLRMQNLSGGMGYEIADMLYVPLRWGLSVLLCLIPICVAVYYTKPYLIRLLGVIKKRQTPASSPPPSAQAPAPTRPAKAATQAVPPNVPAAATPAAGALPKFELEITSQQAKTPTSPPPTPTSSPPSAQKKQEMSFEIEIPTTSAPKEATPPGNKPQPTSSYQLPPLTLLNQGQENQQIRIDREELDQNKEKIIETLTNFHIDIASIKATVGPTVTLYEIVPAPGVRISKIKNLEDDIALSLAALGIRIIAPIPGKGTIGIEVPNRQRELTLLRVAFAHKAFSTCTHELPIVLGKGITGEIQVVDLTRMPHVLMAGATGQGKSVGLNVMLSSLLYKKTPEHLKLVLIDPKKVELTLFSQIERHFLAKLPDGAEAIITDTQQVVHTLNSLCQEMDNRYEILKKASCRNLKEYNDKCEKTQTTPPLPYIVLVIDELADLMMTAGKEVETPIARLAQLARAIGIHLIVATQRPSVNVITGIIKANFPARISYRVTSQIDSRTILDARGAEQLIGMGDMLFSTGNEHLRLQCPYVDTQEVEAICAFISKQPTDNPPFLLPEVAKKNETRNPTDDIEERDIRFEEAATLIVHYQQGSASLIQRKMKLGFNRAGRLIDQMEAIGIVGPPMGSKPREVLIQDEYALQTLLNTL